MRIVLGVIEQLICAFIYTVIALSFIIPTLWLIS